MNIKSKDYNISVNSESKQFLTEREIEYLSLIALGCHNQEIAKTLEVSYYTVKKTIELIFHKLNAADRANAVAIAFVHKILDISTLNEIINKYRLIKNIALRKKITSNK